MYCVIGAHVCENCDGPIPAYYGSYNNLTLAQRAVRRAYLQIEHGITDEDDAEQIAVVGGADRYAEIQAEATRYSRLAYEFPQRVAETDTIWIVNAQEWN